ncbi:hypothetical protein HER39_14475 [Arthrobacter deserti]|uniref:ABC transporter permease n=1 Tax=Arthrobacter deserti TaxID=1742687 RepID=A0ABX1JR14_9MICC|nr:hypothetical protein [Arthrobacter deserti]
MYAWRFRRLPGPLSVRIMLAVLLVLAAVLLLMEFVFPWISRSGPFQGEATLGH